MGVINGINILAKRKQMENIKKIGYSLIEIIVNNNLK